jgi:CheY-like chemotaxis protein
MTHVTSGTAGIQDRYGTVHMDRKYKVAVIEDQEDNREVLRIMLEGHFEVASYGDGLQGLSGIRRDRPDVVLLDISMPRLDGMSVINEIRHDPTLSGIPVIAVTAHAMQGDREKFLSSGFNDYVAKPILNIEALRSLIQNVIEASN